MKAIDVLKGSKFIHVDETGWKTTHILIRKKIRDGGIVTLNQFTYYNDEEIEVI